MLANRNTSTAKAKLAPQVANSERLTNTTRPAAELNRIRLLNKVKTPAQDPVYDFVGVAG
ncbi:MAG: hypothetical protein OFPI_02380 [Osedax symbiont Rs2]|nr:MAG: hypothetical protein OFPI_02380 [Osedax symbiont Rs2]